MERTDESHDWHRSRTWTGIVRPSASRVARFSGRHSVFGRSNGGVLGVGHDDALAPKSAYPNECLPDPKECQLIAPNAARDFEPCAPLPRTHWWEANDGCREARFHCRDGGRI